MMIELIAKIGFFLAVAMFIGIGIGWFLSDLMKKKSTLLEAKALRGTISSRDKQLKALEEKVSLQKAQLYKMTDEGIVNRHHLLKQSNIIQKQSDELYMIQDKLEQIKVLEKDKVECLKSVMELSLQLKERENQVGEYEKKSLLTTDGNLEKRPSIELEKNALEEEIQELRKLLEESYSKLSDEDMIISKDQFEHIEKEFISLKSQIEYLAKEKSELSALLKSSQEKKDNGLIKKINMVFSTENREKRQNMSRKLQKQPNLKAI